MSGATSFADLVAESSRRRLRRAGHPDGISFDVAVLRRVDSTNRLAWRIRKELAEDDIDVEAALLAHEQTAGRGRQGRSWSSAAGMGIYASVCGALAEPRRLPVLPLAAAVAIAEVLDRALPVPCRLKWPNDVMVKGRKLAGILVEAAVREGARPQAIVGFGVNYGYGARELPTPAATSLSVEMREPPPLPALAWDLAEAVARELRSKERRETTVARWSARSLHLTGEPLRCRLADGEEVVGTFLGLTPDGLLRLVVDGREEVMVTAEVEEL
ncbi:MAG TPA: biotin--[acetyl-CoA-carboxylase] ligase [Thermoanaerobaculia bacterium]|nr:biotin--[acetyl-CoA-carboxylase] ligase [Thermoanaerobaculia bacterium]